MSAESSRDSLPQVSLQCLNGASPPPAVVMGWRNLAGFSETAQAAFWEFLGQTVVEPDAPGHQELLESFCGAHGIDATSALGALGACDFLLGNATALNLAPDALQQDLIALSAGQTPLVDEFLARYQSVKPLLRSRLLEVALADHGKILTGLDWRVDNVTASDRGAQLNSTVVYLTMRYRDGDKQDRVTFQLTSEALKLLRSFTNRFES